MSMLILTPDIWHMHMSYTSIILGDEVDDINSSVIHFLRKTWKYILKKIEYNNNNISNDIGSTLDYCCWVSLYNSINMNGLKIEVRLMIIIVTLQDRSLLIELVHCGWILPNHWCVCIISPLYINSWKTENIG